MAAPIRFGIIGLGYWGQLLLQCLQALAAVDIRWVCDVNEGVVETTARQVGAARWTTAWEEMMADPDLDAVCVVTPEHMHLAPVKAALAAGKHVFIEKPIATTLEEAEEMAAAAAQADTFVMPGHIMRFDPRYVLLRQHIEGGRFGQVASVQTRRHMRRSLTRARGGHHVMYRLGIHDIDLALWLVGSPVKRVVAHHRTIQYLDVVDFALATLEHENGALTTLEMSGLLPVENLLVTHSLTVVGEKEMYSLPTFSGAPDLLSVDEGHTTPDVVILPVAPDLVTGLLGTELAYFVNCLAKNIPPDRITISEAVEALKIARAAVEAAERGTAVDL